MLARRAIAKPLPGECKALNENSYRFMTRDTEYKPQLWKILASTLKTA
ncbi:hypothetical protein [Xanthomonas medicagonis]